MVVDVGHATIIGLDRRATQPLAEASMYVLEQKHPGRRYVVRETDGRGLFLPGDASLVALPAVA